MKMFPEQTLLSISDVMRFGMLFISQVEY